MKKLGYLISALFLISSSWLFAQTRGDTAYEKLVKEFVNPPLKAKPFVYYWWLGGHVDTLRLKDEIASMYKAGIGGFTIFEIGSRDTAFVKAGPAFFSKESLNSIKVAVNEAQKYGMDVGLNTASSWNAGGSWIPPVHAAKSIYFSKIEVPINSRKEEHKLPFPDISEKDAWGKLRNIKFKKDGRPEYYEEIAVIAVPINSSGEYIDTSLIIDVTEYFDADKEMLAWNLPNGNWDVYRFVCSNSGENLVLPSKFSTGPILDHFDKNSTEFHFSFLLNKLDSMFGDLGKTSLRSLYMASYEAKEFTWTHTLPAVFKDINGYPISKFLPALFNNQILSKNVNDKFKADFNRTLSEMMINNFYKKSKEICNSYGLKNNSEAGGPGFPLHNVPVEPLKALGSLDIPRGEFWINHHRWTDQGIDILRVVKEVSSASNIYNRNIVEMEAFTSFQHWQEGPFEMKPYGDRAFCEGMNKVVVHGFTHNPEGTGVPGIVYHAGTHYNDKRVWWPKVKPFNDYLARISYILQEADFVADILYYYGDSIPNFGGHKYSRIFPGIGFDYEIVNTEILLNASVDDRCIKLPGSRSKFKILVVENEHSVNPAVLHKLNELAKNGILIIGEKPKQISNMKPGESDTYLQLLDELWDQDLREGRNNIIHSGIKVNELITLSGIYPDIKFPGLHDLTLDYIHYQLDDLDFYFIRNTTSNKVSAEVGFRQQNRIPEMWDPMEGTVMDINIFRVESSYIWLPINLAPFESKFIVFRKGDRKPKFSSIVNSEMTIPQISYEDDGIIIWDEGSFSFLRGNERTAYNNTVRRIALGGPWLVRFEKNQGAPDKVVLPELRSLNESEDLGIKYYSGIATYEKNFINDPIISQLGQKRYFLDLGDFANVAEVWINDIPAGILWAKPYRIEITNLVKPGQNTLKIEVANTRSNRIVGDKLNKERFTRTNIVNTDILGATGVRLPWEEVPLIKSGLFGPVNVLIVNDIKFTNN